VQLSGGALARHARVPSLAPQNKAYLEQAQGSEDGLCLCSANDSQASKILAYNRANRAVAVLCNHQRAAPRTFMKSLQTLHAKVGKPMLVAPHSPRLSWCR
jgi:hypothetical protein